MSQLQMPPMKATDSGEARSLDEAHKQCAQRGARLTPIRRLVLRLLQQHPDGVKAYQLLAVLRRYQKNATPPTVYRALDFLIAQGLAYRVNSMSLFVPSTRGTLRRDTTGVILVCPLCHSVTELHDSATLKALSSMLTAAGHQLEEQTIEIGAICPVCISEDESCRR